MIRGRQQVCIRPDPDGHIVNTGSLIVVSTDGVAVLDGQGDVAQTQALVDAIGKLTPQPIKYVIASQQQGAILRVYEELDGKLQ